MPINWELIRRQYDQMIRYASAIRKCTDETESILRRFTRENPMHPTYQALPELGWVLRTVFLCEYLHSETLRREIHEGFNVVELWNDVNDFILFDKGGEIATNRKQSQALAMLSLHLLQNCLVYINTLMVKHVLNDPVIFDSLEIYEFRVLTLLFFSHINPHGIFRLDMESRLALESEMQEAA